MKASTPRASFPAEALEARIAPAKLTALFDFESQPGGVGSEDGTLTSLDLADDQLKIQITRSGSTFDVVDNGITGQQKPGQFGGRTLSPFSDVSASPFIINLSLAAKEISLLLGDFAQDEDDALVVRAYSEPDGGGTLIDEDTGTLSNLGTDVFNFEELQVKGDSIKSIVVIGGTTQFPNSAFLDNIRVTYNPIDLVAKKLKWNTQKGGVTAVYEIAGGDLAESPTSKAQLFWATGPSLEDRLSLISAAEFEPKAKANTYSVNIPGRQLHDAPPGATHILLILDEVTQVGEIDEENNVAALQDVAITIGPNVLGGLTTFSETVIKELLRDAGEAEATVSSLLRTPEEQARIMFDNIQQHGFQHQYKLYGGRPGQMVLDAYREAVTGLTRREIREHRPEIEAAMVSEINELGPGNVSAHMRDPGELQAIDLAPSSFAASTKSNFVAAVRGDGRVTNFIPPPKDPAYHLEIGQT